MIRDPFRRNPKNYDGNKLTTKSLMQFIPKVLGHIDEQFIQRPDLVIAAWSEIIGPKFAPMTEAESFMDGVLKIKVKNSMLFSLLSRNDPQLIQKLREKFPNISIKTILFRIG